MIHVTTDINCATVGSMPRGATPLHMACNGGDVAFEKFNLVKALLTRRADLEAQDAGGRTPLLQAAATGITDVVKLLISARANIHATNSRGVGALQMAKQASGTTAKLLEDAGCELTFAGSCRTRATTNPSRASRYAMSSADENSPWGFIHDGSSWHQWRKDKGGGKNGKGKKMKGKGQR